MSDVAQEQELAVDPQPVPNEAETQDEQVETDAQETDEQSPEAEQDNEPEKTVEERLAELEEDTASKQKAIDRKTAAYSSLQKAHEKTLQELQELQSKLQAEEPLKEPVIDDYETHEDYIKDLREYDRTVGKREGMQESQEQSLQQQQQSLAMERAVIRNKQEADFTTTHPDYPLAKQEFDTFIQSVNAPPALAQAVADQAFEGDIAQLIYHFAGNNGENMDKLAEISAMSPVKAGIEIYKIQQTLKAPEKPEVKPAPPPVSKPKGGGKPRKDINSMSGDEVLKHMGFK